MSCESSCDLPELQRDDCRKTPQAYQRRRRQTSESRRYASLSLRRMVSLTQVRELARRNHLCKGAATRPHSLSAMRDGMITSLEQTQVDRTDARGGSS